jgi:nitrogen regulatory protein P-II 2
MMQKHTKTQLTVVAEAALEPRLVAELKRHKAHVWTVREVRGAFPEGERSGDSDFDRTIELRVICDAVVADALAEVIVTKYAPHYSVVLHLSEVQVLRPERY